LAEGKQKTESVERIRLLLVDDHPVVRDGLRRIQDLERRLQIVGEAATVQGAVEVAQQTRPDVVLMDVRLPDGDGIEACRRIKGLLPQTRILFLTSFADNRFVLAAMEAGAEGYLLKESDAQRIINAILSVLQGGTVFDPVVTREVMSGLRRGDAVNPLTALTAQERRLLGEVAKGRTDKEVAASLGLTTKTARNYLDRIFTKLNVHTRTEAALLYTRRMQGGSSND
jgi:DNA-binding NarL/FixJ family response regulator